MWSEDDKLMRVYASFNDGGDQFPKACPACGESHAHVLMHRPEPTDSRGTVWVWCDSCGSYAHFSAVVPAWWSNPAFVDEDCLDSLVDYPDSMRAQIDEWVNGLLE